METKLQVRDLRISFRTTNGKVQAVRGINFDLAKGETLAIVGESGSGKSVTSKAILGIQARNAITESGEIIYDGKDLLKISEDDFHKIRGDKISMIFQDPMSSLNPIVKIGRQLTEAMILKGAARQRESRKNFNTFLKTLNDSMISAIAGGNTAKADELTAMCKKFDKFEFKHIELEGAFVNAKEAAKEAIDDIDVLAFELGKNAAKDAAYRVKSVANLARNSIHEYVVKAEAERLKTLADSLPDLFNCGKKHAEYDKLIAAMHEIREILERAVALPEPDFFRMGYYLQFSGKPLPEMDVPDLNEYLLQYLSKEFMNEFFANAKQGISYSAEASYRSMEEAIHLLRENAKYFENEHLNRSEAYHVQKLLSEKVEASIDRLAIVKDSLSYTFGPGIKSELDRYFTSIGKNAKAVRKYERTKRKHDRLIARGKTVDWEVAAAAVTDLDLVRENILHLIDRLANHYEDLLQGHDTRDYDAETNAAIDYLKTNAQGVVAKVTKRIARDRAIRLMEEVGIAEPRKRYNQYPFEFSGGMRQRIVIAIALAANPDILICDEPTTALDVTIQSQILELINNLKAERQLSVIFITHDLGVVANMADRVAVMYAGKIVEYGTAEDIFYHAAHPYTWALLSSMPDLDTNEKLEAIPGTPPNMIYPPKGDAFAARNKYAMQIDFELEPPMFKISDTHYAATWLLHPDAPKVEPPKIMTDRIARMKLRREGAADAE